MPKRIMMIGCGLSNASLARMLADDGHYVEIHERLGNVGGMLRDSYDKESEAYVSETGPHTIHFRRSTTEAYDFLTKHTKLVPYKQQTLCIGNGSFTFWPINTASRELLSAISPDSDAYDEYVRTYSQKMWGENYAEVTGNISERIEFADTRELSTFPGQKQYQPENGYSNMIRDLIRGCKLIMSSSMNIDSLKNSMDEWDYIFVSSNIDEFFKFKHGELEFRGLDFEFHRIRTDGSNLLPAPIVNLNSHPRIIRVSEINQLQARESRSEVRVICIDIPGSKSNRFYPVSTKKNMEKLALYIKEAKKYPNLILHGRTSEYKYLDMDTAVQSSIELYKKLTDKI